MILRTWVLMYVLKVIPPCVVTDIPDFCTGVLAAYLQRWSQVKPHSLEWKMHMTSWIKYSRWAYSIWVAVYLIRGLHWFYFSKYSRTINMFLTLRLKHFNFFQWIIVWRRIDRRENRVLVTVWHWLANPDHILFNGSKLKWRLQMWIK